MKQITLPKVLEALVFEREAIEVDADVATRARASVERMIELSS
jgi:quinolinate synthase